MQLKAEFGKLAFALPLNCFYDPEMHQVVNIPLQLLGCREGDRFFVRSKLPIFCSQPSPAEEYNICNEHGCCVVFYRQERLLFAKVLMMNEKICIGKYCRPGESLYPELAGTSSAFKQLRFEDCCVVLKLSSLQNKWLSCVDAN